MSDSGGRSVRRWKLPGDVPWRAVAGLVAALIAIAAILTFLGIEPEPGGGQGGTGGAAGSNGSQRAVGSPAG